MIKDIIDKYRSREMDLSCSEIMLLSANEAYNLNLQKETVKAMAAFGGGMGVEGVCGAISGSLAALGVMFVNERAHESSKIKSISKEFFDLFQKKLGTNNCKELKSRYRNEEFGCRDILYAAGGALEEIINNERK